MKDERRKYMAGFEPSEIQRQARRIREQIKDYTYTCSDLNEMYNHEKRLLNYETTNRFVDNNGNRIHVPFLANGNELARVINQFQDNYNDMLKSITNDFNELADIMDSWASKSLSAEEKASGNVDVILNKLRNIQAILDSIQ